MGGTASLVRLAGSAEHIGQPAYSASIAVAFDPESSGCGTPQGERMINAHRIGRHLAALAAAVTLLLAAGATAQAQRQLVMYCSVDEKWCRAMANAYQKETGVQVDMTRMSAGETYARVRAEKENPHGDI